MPASDAGLLSNERCHLFKFLAVNVAIPVQIEHPEGNFKMAAGS